MHVISVMRTHSAIAPPTTIQAMAAAPMVSSFRLHTANAHVAADLGKICHDDGGDDRYRDRNRKNSTKTHTSFLLCLRPERGRAERRTVPAEAFRPEFGSSRWPVGWPPSPRD